MMARIQAAFSPPLVLFESAIIRIGSNHTKKTPAMTTRAIPKDITGNRATPAMTSIKRIKRVEITFIVLLHLALLTNFYGFPELVAKFVPIFNIQYYQLVNGFHLYNPLSFQDKIPIVGKYNQNSPIELTPGTPKYRESGTLACLSHGKERPRINLMLE
jgi:hypothetical protein